MPFMRIDVGFPGHPKALAIGGDGVWLFLSLLSYCKTYGTDGWVPAEAIANVPGPRRKQEHALKLVAAGLLTKQEGGYLVHDYLQWEESAEQAAASRAKCRERVRKFRSRHADLGSCNGVTNALVTEHVTQTDRAAVTGTIHDRYKLPPPASLRSAGPPPAGVGRAGHESGVDVEPGPGHAPVEGGGEVEGRPSRGRKPKLAESGKHRITNRKQRLPDEWSPSDSHRELATRLNADLDREAQAFRDHAAANGRVQSDWDASFRVWLNKSSEFASRNRSAKPYAQQPPQPNGGWWEREGSKRGLGC